MVYANCICKNDKREVIEKSNPTFFKFSMFFEILQDERSSSFRGYFSTHIYMYIFFVHIFNIVKYHLLISGYPLYKPLLHFISSKLKYSSKMTILGCLRRHFTQNNLRFKKILLAIC